MSFWISSLQSICPLSFRNRAAGKKDGMRPRQRTLPWALCDCVNKEGLLHPMPQPGIDVGRVHPRSLWRDWGVSTQPSSLRLGWKLLSRFDSVHRSLTCSKTSVFVPIPPKRRLQKVVNTIAKSLILLEVHTWRRSKSICYRGPCLRTKNLERVCRRFNNGA